MPRIVRHLRHGIKDVASRIFRIASPKPVGYVGWLGFNNLGDEALFEAIGELMNPIDLREYSAVREVVLGRIRPPQFRGVLLGGGTLIGPGFLRPVRLASQRGLPLYSFGSGVGSSGFGEAPIVDLAGWSEVLRHFAKVSVRGYRSEERLAEIGIRNVRVIGDPALTLGPCALPPLRSQPTVVLNLSLSEHEKYGAGRCSCYREVARIARDHASKGGNVIAVAMGAMDSEVLEECLVDAGLTQTIISRPRTSKEFFRLVSGAHCLIGVRLHAAVLAAAVGTMPIMIAYREKSFDFMESIGMKDHTIEEHEHSGHNLRCAYEKAMAATSTRTDLFTKVQHWRVVQQDFALELQETINHPPSTCA